ncbi:MAG TPA: diguanylate cyclase [Thermoanaerobaculia bacterium]
MSPDVERRKSPVSEPTALRLLIVDDDPAYRAWIATLTKRLGYGVETAEDGVVGLERLLGEHFDVVIVDQEMPRMSGLELIAGIRSESSLTGLYAVMLTGHDDIETKLAALATGFDDFLSKSSQEVEIAAKLVAARRVATRQLSLDVTARELYGLANRDELTGLFNRRFFISHTQELLAQGAAAVSIILFDLDDFKTINDTYGHVAGDQILRDVGSLFHRTTRLEDVIARYGGDEFVMVIPDLEVSDIEAIAKRLSTEVRALLWQAGASAFGIGVTTGVASSRLLTAPTVEQLLNAADRDLYRGKWLRKHPGTQPLIADLQKGTPVDLLNPKEKTAEPAVTGARPSRKKRSMTSKAAEPGTT